MSKKKRVGILISGRGSNMESLITACKAPDFPARIVTVISNRPKAAGLQIAANEGIQTRAVDHRQYKNREAFEAVLHQALVEADVELVCNAGFMRLLTAGFVDKWRDRQLNIHPSLLPAFKGLHTHQRVLDAGAKITGCTVHLVRTEMDAGPIIAQAAVCVKPDDNADTLAARVLAAEHRLYPHALAMIASGKLIVEGNIIKCSTEPEFTDSASCKPLYAPGLSMSPVSR